MRMRYRLIVDLLLDSVPVAVRDYAPNAALSIITTFLLFMKVDRAVDIVLYLGFLSTVYA